MRLFPLIALLAIGCRADKGSDEGEDPGLDTAGLESDGDSDGYNEDEDCDDADALINPGADEVCDEVDNNCDGQVDEGAQSTFYADADEDGFGDPGSSADACDAPAGYVADNTDCDDSDAAAFPGGTEVCDEADNDCDGSADEGVQTKFYADIDGDGYGIPNSTTESCERPAGYADTSDDCDDEDALVNPGAAEICNEIDDDCDGTVDDDAQTTFYADDDGDGFGDSADTAESCGAPAGYVADDTDCDDADALVNPGASEICNDVDDDCDGTTDEAGALDEETWYADADDDGFGDAGSTAEGCVPPDGYVPDDTDCDDADSSVYPGALDVCDGGDNDCDALLDEDALGGASLATIDEEVLYSFDLVSGAATAEVGIDGTDVGDWSLNTFSSRLDDGLTILHDSTNNRLLEVDVCSGLLSELGDTGVGNTCGIAFGPGGDLYGIDTDNDTLVRFDVATGAGTTIGSLGFDLLNCGLSYDCATDTLYGLQIDPGPDTGEIFAVNVSTGAATTLVSLDTDVSWGNAGIEYDPAADLFYVMTGTGVYRIDPLTGEAELLSGDVAANNLAFADLTCPE